MKTCYTMQFSPAVIGIADLVSPGELAPGWTITRINIPNGWRGRGFGSQLLGRVTDDADAEGVRLWLEVLPSGPLDYAALVQWYWRKGFVHSKYGGYMIRRPRVTEDAK